MSYDFFMDLAIIIISAKLFGLVARKLHAPQVVGEIAAGLIIGPSMLGIVAQSEFINQMAEIGVILLMFLAGLETNLKDLLKTGPAALAVACAGVALPLVGGYIVYSCFYGFADIGSEEFLKAVFTGVILTATSVSITVQTLRELGHLKSKTGTLIMGAAIIDDVIGIIVLTFVIGFKSPDSNALDIILNTVLFFAFALIVGYVSYRVFKYIDKRYEHKRRIAIFGFALCLVLSFVAERYFGIADITGAYVAGIILCSLKDSSYIADKMDISSYMMFGPIFFASIGLKTEFSGFSMSILLFTICFIVVALITKIIGCGLMSRAFGFKGKDCLRVGVGMMNRGEVALIVAQKGLSVGLLDSIFFAPVILLILISSVVTPIVMKVLYRGEASEDTPTDAPPADTTEAPAEVAG